MEVDALILKCVSMGNGKWFPAFISDVWYVPELRDNLFYLIVAEMKGYRINAENSQIQLIRNDIVVGTGVRDGKSLYKMNMRVITPDEPAAVYLTDAVEPKNEKLQFWHERLCHQNKKHVKEFLEQEGVNLPLNEYFCGELIHADVFGPTEESSDGHQLLQL